jgi:hypothetical protein
LHFLSITVEVTFAKIKKQTMLKKLYPKIKKIKKNNFLQKSFCFGWWRVAFSIYFICFIDCFLVLEFARVVIQGVPCFLGYFPKFEGKILSFFFTTS